MSQEEILREDSQPATEALIAVTQLPVIEERLQVLKAEIERAVTGALAMEVNESNRKAAKDQLASLRKGIRALEDQRLAVRRAILAPYDEMEITYRKCVTDVWKPAETQLSARITEIENGLIEKKRAEVEPYFKELCTAHNIDFLQLEDARIKINLTNTVKSLKAQCKAFIDRVTDDLAAISLHEHCADILVEYKRNDFNQQRATVEVCRRIEAANAERARQERIAVQREQEAAAAQAIQAAAEEYPAPEPLAAPVMETAPEQQTEEVIIWVPFKVGASMKVLKEEIPLLKQYLENRGLRYE